MQFDHHHVPYSQQGMERLAEALEVDPAQLWVNQHTHRMELRSSSSAHSGSEDATESVQEPSD